MCFISITTMSKNPDNVRFIGCVRFRVCKPISMAHYAKKIYGDFKESLKRYGADRDRTCDILLAKQALSQLSYSPETDKWA